jgi:hypothetical protein
MDLVSKLGRVFVIVACVIAFAAATSSAQGVGGGGHGTKVEVGGPPVILVGPDCDITAYKGEERQFSPPLVIPDADPAGVSTPPIIIPPDGDNIDDVIIKVRASHTWIGDLIIVVSYYPDCNPAVPPVSAVLLCRPDVSGDPAQTPVPCGSNANGLGCASNLDCNNTYSFSDEAIASLGVGTYCGATSSTVLPTGCYKPSVGGTPLSVFRGLRKGGCWTLTVSDNASIDTGALCGWSVFLRNQHPTPTLGASWGQMKGMYR